MLEIRKNRFGQQRSIHERERRKRTAKRVVFAVVILLVLIICGAIVYVWYMGRHPVKQTSQIDTTSAAPTIKTYTPADDAVVSIVQESYSGPEVAAGSNASISIKTNPGAACQITVKVNNSFLADTGLVPKIADEFGIVNWSWSIPKNILPGTWPVEITCANAKKSAYYKADLVVAR